MNVASLTLCKELYELSGWYDMEVFYVKSFTKKDEYKNAVWELENYSSYAEHMTKEDFVQSNVVPAYDLGYLLRKLPITDTSGDHWEMWRSTDNKWWIEYQPGEAKSADTPEDAAATLVIELFKQGILSKEPLKENTSHE